MQAIQSTHLYEKYLIEPYQIGYLNILDGLKGRTTPIRYSDGSSSFVRDLQNPERVSSIVAGALLCIPVINSIVFYLLEKLNSAFLYMKNQELSLSTRSTRQVSPPQPSPPQPSHPLEDLTKTMRVNRAALNRVPLFFDLHALTPLVTEANPPVSTEELLTQFDEILNQPHSTGLRCRGRDVLFVDEGSQIDRNSAKNQIKINLIHYANKTHDGSRYNQMVAKELELILKLIVLEFRKPEISHEKKVEALIRLASASFHCAPRRHTETLKVYRTLLSQIETIEDALLGAVQMAKEDLFLAHYCHSTEPVMTLNYIRKKVDTLGLDRNPIHLKDIHMGRHDALTQKYGRPDTTKEEFIAAFNSFYTAANVIPIVRDYLNRRMESNPDFRVEISQFIANEITQCQEAGILSEAEVALLPLPYQNESYELLPEGVKFLLIHFGLFTDTNSESHLFRATKSIEQRRSA